MLIRFAIGANQMLHPAKTIDTKIKLYKKHKKKQKK